MRTHAEWQDLDRRARAGEIPCTPCGSFDEVRIRRRPGDPRDIAEAFCRKCDPERRAKPFLTTEDLDAMGLRLPNPEMAHRSLDQVYELLRGGATSAELAEMGAGYAAKLLHVRLEERGRIVAFLRERRLEDVSRRELADAIERGEHRT